jgi:hypothetical protein
MFSSDVITNELQTNLTMDLCFAYVIYYNQITSYMCKNYFQEIAYRVLEISQNSLSQ